MVQPIPSWKINNKTVKNIGFHFFPHVVTLYVSFFEIGPFNQVTCYSKFLFGRVRCCCPYSLIFRLYLQTPAHPKQIYPRFPFHQKTLPKKAVVYSSQVRFNPPSPSPTSRFLFFRRGGRPEHRGVNFFGQRYCLGSWNWNFDPFQVVPPPCWELGVGPRREFSRNREKEAGRLKKG